MISVQEALDIIKENIIIYEIKSQFDFLKKNPILNDKKINTIKL